MLCYRGVLFVTFLYWCSSLNGASEILNYEQFEEDNEILNAENVALLIEDSPKNFQNALNIISSVLKNSAQTFWLITFNSSGVSTIWKKNSSHNISELDSVLQTLSTNSHLNVALNNMSLPFFAILHTAQILPKDSAIIAVTNSYINMDSHLENVALNTVLTKNITVYSVDNEGADFLQNIREYSGGKIMKISQMVKYENYRHITYVLPDKASIILSRKNLMNANKLSFPIDDDISGIHIAIQPTTTSGVLTSASGYRFSFSSKSKSFLIRYSEGSFFENQNLFYSLHLNLSTSGRPTVGVWRLTLENFKEVYNVTVFVFSSIEAKAQLNFFDKGVHKSRPKDVMKLGVTGNISHITDISVLDMNGDILLGNITHKFNKDRLKYVTENADNLADIGNKVVEIEIDDIKRTQPFYALIRGKDIKGNVFQRLSYLFGKSDIYPQQSVTIEVGLGSELIVDSGRKAEVYFEVTNYGTNAQLVTFSCSDSKYILQSLSIYRRYLEPQESTIATLNLNTRVGSYQDEITFSVNSGSSLIRKKVLVDVGTQVADITGPELDYRYTSDCTGVLFAQCTKGTWTIEITARDVDSGLMQLNTIPKGLFFPYGYTSGTKDSVVGYYSESCCNPKLQISAVDRLNNRRSYDVNAYYARWSAGAIAALVLGILLFLILVAVIVFFAVRKYKQKESYDLPTYGGGGI